MCLNSCEHINIFRDKFSFACSDRHRGLHNSASSCARLELEKFTATDHFLFNFLQQSSSADRCGMAKLLNSLLAKRFNVRKVNAEASRRQIYDLRMRFVRSDSSKTLRSSFAARQTCRFFFRFFVLDENFLDLNHFLQKYN